MRELFKIIKGNFILLLGTGLFTYSLFSFNSDYYEGLGRLYTRYPSLSSPPTYPISITTYYYYDDTSIILLTIGVILIAIGLIKIKTKKDKK